MARPTPSTVRAIRLGRRAWWAQQVSLLRDAGRVAAQTGASQSSVWTRAALLAARRQAEQVSLVAPEQDLLSEQDLRSEQHLLSEQARCPARQEVQAKRACPTEQR